MKEVTIDKKYELTDETIEHNGHTLHRIRALRDFGSVKSGQLGGFVESEDNLSHEGNCWIAGNAKVYGHGSVRRDASVRHRAEVYDDAIITDEAIVDYEAKVYGKATVTDNASISDHAKVYERAYVSNHALVYGNAKVLGSTSLSGFAHVYEHATVCDKAKVYGNANVYGHASVTDGSVNGHARIKGDAVISSASDYIVFKNWWSSGRYFTWTRSNNMWKVGCFYGTGNQLITRAKLDSPEKGREYERIVRYVESILANEEPTPIREAIPVAEPTSVPTVEPPKVPSIDEVLGLVESLEGCSDSEIAKIVYDLATGVMSLDDFNKWTICISLYIDDNEVDHDSTEFSLSDIQNGEVNLGSFSLDYYLNAIEYRVSDFLSNCISEWNGEDDGEFEESWEMDCNMGCSHNVRCEISIERD